MLASCGVHVPRVQAADTARGFLLLEDLGSEPYLTRLRAHADPEKLYGDAMAALLRMQLGLRDAVTELPPYDRSVLEREMALMPEWFCTATCSCTSTPRSGPARGDIRVSQRQAAGAAHRVRAPRFPFAQPDDSPQRNPGVIDFQDALAGPVGYDLVSLLKDCYIDWPRRAWRAGSAPTAPGCARPPNSSGASERSFCAGSTSWACSGTSRCSASSRGCGIAMAKAGYLQDLPRTLGYVQDDLRRYAELRDRSRPGSSNA